MKKEQFTGLEIAIIGMAIKFPGANTIEEFWRNLSDGMESVKFLTDEELKKLGFDDALIKNPDYIRSAGGLVDRKEYFDASFFGYTPPEAILMDPQTRIFHEVTWKALEDSGYNVEKYGGRIGLFAGSSNSSYWEAMAELSGSTREMGQFASMQLTSKDYLTTKVSYKLNLKGPSYSVQTACSTSLVAVHLACRALLLGESDVAVAGGVSISPHAESGYLYEDGMILSKDGHCRSFDAKASGANSGNGAGVVILKPLKKALEDRDHIYAVIKGSAINNDGNRKTGYSAPSVKGQMEVIRAALNFARVDPKTIQYVECHGTATALGDPIELEALQQAFQSSPPDECAVGCVKPNIGHLDSAAGIAGLIKATLLLKNKQFVPSINYTSPNPKINFSGSPFYVNTELKDWTGGDAPRRAGVSSFGIGGTNAHVILEEAPSIVSSPSPRKYQLLVTSAKTSLSLDGIRNDLFRYLNEHPEIDLADAAYSLKQGRVRFAHRQFSVVENSSRYEKALPTENYKTLVTPASDPSVVFLFPGGGAQYVNMAKDVYASEPAFKATVDEGMGYLQKLTGIDYLDFLFPSETAQEGSKKQMEDTEIALPVLFIVEYALAKLLIEWGITPKAMIGHSLGEYVAACVANVFSYPDALKLVLTRGKLMKKVEEGAMLSISASIDQVRPGLHVGISVAAINSHTNCVLAGSKNQMAALKEHFTKQGIDAKIIPIAVASHSTMMDPILAEFQEALSQIDFNKPEIPYLSNVTGDWVTTECTTPQYWAAHIRNTVLFSPAVEKVMGKYNDCVFVEAGPSNILCNLVKQHNASGAKVNAVNILRHPGEQFADDYFLLDKIGELWLYGCEFNWNSFYNREDRCRIPLPTYHFDQQRYWIDNKVGAINPIHAPSPSKREKPDNWFYLPAWKSYTVNTRVKASRNFDQLLLIGDSYITQSLWAQLRKENINVIMASPGKAGDYMLADNSVAAYDALLSSLILKGTPIYKIVFIADIILPGNPLDAAPVASYQEAGFYALVNLVKAASKHGISGNLEIDVITNGMHEVMGNETGNFSLATILAPVKVMSQENPGIKCRNIDVYVPTGNGAVTMLMPQLVSEIMSDITEPVVSLRNSKRWLPLYEPYKLSAFKNTCNAFRQNGTYLVTGGLGRIGFTLIDYISRKYKVNLIITGKTPLPDRRDWNHWLTTHGSEHATSKRINKIKSLEGNGSTVVYRNIDVTDADGMKQLIDQNVARFGRIDGIIHSTAITGMDYLQAITEIDRATCETHFHSKIYGLLSLADAVKNIDYDFCLLMSSVSSVLGGLGFVAYSGANIFMDYLTQHINRTGRKNWISVAWDGWEYLEDEVAGSPLQEDSLRMTVSEGPQALESILNTGLNGVVIHSLTNLDARLNTWVIKNDTCSIDVVNPKDQRAARYDRPDILTPYKEPTSVGEMKLVEIWQNFFKYDRIGVNDNFFELGGNSLKGVSLNATIHKKLKVQIPIKEFFNAGNISNLAAIISQSQQQRYRSIPVAERKEYYPLSSAQLRLYLAHALDKSSRAYNETYTFEIRGKLHKDRLQRAIDRLIADHEVFRTHILIHQGQPVQVIMDSTDCRVSFADSNLKNVGVAIAEFVAPFDMDCPPYFRAALYRINDDHHILVFDLHHIITDGISMNIVLKMLSQYYATPDIQVKRLDLQYKDYSEWQTNNRRNPGFQRQKDFWLQEFSESILPLNLPCDFNRPAVRGFEGATLNFEIGQQQVSALYTMVQEKQISLYVILLTVYNVFLSKLTSQEDITLGTPASGRPVAELENMMGMFVNTLVMRNNIDRTHCFNDLVKQVNEKTMQVFANQDYQYESLVEDLKVERDAARNPLFDVVFTFQNMESDSIHIPGTTFSPFNYSNPSAKFDLILAITENDKKLFFSFTYSTTLFKKETLQRFVAYFESVVAKVLHYPLVPVGELEILSDADKQLVVKKLNGPAATYPQQTVRCGFEEQVRKFPDRVAVKFEDTELTYRALNHKADQVAWALAGRGVLPNSIVAIYLDQSVEVIYGILGVIKAGCAYVPIDVNYPQERVEFILKDSNASFLLSTREIAGKMASSCEVLFLDDDDIYSGPDVAYVKPALKPDDLLYIIYTSGTTGNPKGVMIGHKNVIRLLFNSRFQFAFNEHDTWSLYHSHAFDFSVWEMYGALLYGGKLVVVPKLVTKDSASFFKLAVREKITVLNQTPTAFYNLAHEATKQDDRLTLRYVIFGGEALSPGKLAGWVEKYPHTKLVNMYGITETTVHVTFKVITQIEIARNISNIGKPIPTLTAYILSKDGKLLPEGVPGELFVGGEGVAKGYLNRPELTSERFIQSPFNKNEKLYRSGDLVRLLSNGDMEYLGRIDHQVKIRGYRIELGEIEHQLTALADITDAVVVPLENSAGEKSLCAYFVSNIRPSAPVLRSTLMKQLPEYMVPAYFMQVDKIPLTNHGKVDKKALPKPVIGNAAHANVSPRNQVEVQLVEIWKRTLELDNVSISNNFFHVGGDSIKAIRLISNINSHFKSNIGIVDLYVNGTIEKLSGKILEQHAGGSVRGNAAVLGQFNALKHSVIQQIQHPERIEDVFPMTEIELGMVFNYKKNLGTGVYHDQFLFNLRFESFDNARFLKALGLLVNRHEILRSAFNISDFDEFVQIVYREVVLPVEYEDHSTLSIETFKNVLASRMASDIEDAYHEGNCPLWRMKLYKFSPHDFVLLLSFHHAILDGWSVASLMTELNNTYYRLQEDAEFVPVRLNASYKDAALCEHIDKNSKEHLSFWVKELSGYQRMELPFVIARDKHGEMKIYKRRLGTDVLRELNTVTNKFNSSVKNVLFAAYLYTLKIFSNSDEIIAGWVTNNRPLQQDGDKILGCFLNTIPVRVKIPALLTYAQYVAFIDEKIQAIRNYERVPLFQIAKAIGEKSKDTNPIFDTLFNFVNFHVFDEARQVEELEGEGYAEPFSDGSQNTNTLFDFEVSITGGDLLLLPKYDVSQVSPGFVSKFCDYYVNILNKFMFFSDEVVSVNAIIPENEKSQIVDDFNDSACVYNRNITIHELFEQKVAEAPRSRAVIYKNEEVTYDALNRWANQLAFSLRAHGVGKDALVGIVIERSVEMIVGMLAVLKAGGAYVPLEPHLPNARVSHIIGDLNIATVITSSFAINKIGEFSSEVPCLKNIFCLSDSKGDYKFGAGVKVITKNDIVRLPATNLESLSRAGDLAYVIFTSGSTGMPKGVVVRHRPVINIIEWINKAYHVTPDDKLLFITSMGFDLSVYDVFGILAAGATIRLLGYDDLSDPKGILDIIMQERITIWDSAPAAIQLVVPLLDHIAKHKLESRLRLIMLSGDWIPVTLPDVLRNAFHGAQVVSLGGATEATIWSNYFNIANVEPHWKSIPYGKPIQNCRYYIFNEDLEICPIGVPGDLYIGGECLSSGYINDLKLTTGKFIKNPLNHDEVIYKTGDLARWFDDGNMEFLGRKDGQVKIRGFRIETGEIESLLIKHPDVMNTVVLAHTNKQNEKYLCAYIVMKSSGRAVSVSVFKTYLSQSIPDYMIPDHYIVLPEIPVTANGKVNRKLLLAPEVSSDVEFIAPANKVEEELSAIWHDILGVDEPISVVADFFELGGHSLNVAVLISKLQKTFQVEISIREIFFNTNIKSQAALIGMIAFSHDEPEQLAENRESIII